MQKIIFSILVVTVPVIIIALPVKAEIKADHDKMVKVLFKLRSSSQGVSVLKKTLSNSDFTWLESKLREYYLETVKSKLKTYLEPIEKGAKDASIIIHSINNCETFYNDYMNKPYSDILISEIDSNTSICKKVFQPFLIDESTILPILSNLENNIVSGQGILWNKLLPEILNSANNNINREFTLLNAELDTHLKDSRLTDVVDETKRLSAKLDKYRDFIKNTYSLLKPFTSIHNTIEELLKIWNRRVNEIENNKNKCYSQLKFIKEIKTKSRRLVNTHDSKLEEWNPYVYLSSSNDTIVFTVEFAKKLKQYFSAQGRFDIENLTQYKKKKILYSQLPELNQSVIAFKKKISEKASFKTSIKNPRDCADYLLKNYNNHVSRGIGKLLIELLQILQKC